jgi:succinyl-diaminopimelate desuccinylase
MKGGLAAMMCAAHDLAEQQDVRIRLVIVPDEESEDIEVRSSDDLVRRGYVGDFAITGEPTNLHIGVEAKGVLAARVLVRGRAAHGSTPWLGDNAIVKAVDVFRRIESMPFSRESSDMFDRPSINLGRIVGGDAPNKVPDACMMDVDIRYLPNQDPGDILEEIRAIPDIEIKRTFVFPPAHVSRSNPYVRALAEVVGTRADGAAVSVGRDGASDAVSFLRAGIPAVEFGPAGAGHHGPDEWVSIRSLAQYRQLLVDFARGVPARLAEGAGPLRAVVESPGGDSIASPLREHRGEAAL